MKTHQRMRVYHRYLGYFLAGIMMVYAVSGISLIFRDTDYFKIKTDLTSDLGPGIPDDELGSALEMRRFRVDSTFGDQVFFRDGVYDRTTGIAAYTRTEMPFVLDKMCGLHKATSGSSLSFLNVFFGLSLIFYVISSFWMYFPGTDVFKKGLYVALTGVIFALILVFV